MCDETFWNVRRRKTQEKSSLPAGCATRPSETSREDTHRRKAFCMRDVPRDILKRHKKIHTGENPFTCRMCQYTFWNIMRRYTQEKSLLPTGCVTRPLSIGLTRNVTQDQSPLPAGYAMRHSETSWEDTYRRKTLCLQDVRRGILKCQVKIHKEEKPFACEMSQDIFWNITRSYTQEKSPLPAGSAMGHSEMTREDTHRRKALWCRMCDNTFLIVMWKYTQEKSHLLCWS